MRFAFGPETGDELAQAFFDFAVDFSRVSRGEAEVRVGHFVSEDGAEEESREAVDDDDGGDVAPRADVDGSLGECEAFLPGELRATHDTSERVFGGQT